MNSTLFVLKERLSKEDFDLVMEIYFTTAEELYKEVKKQQEEEDYHDLEYLERRYEEFQKLYLQNLDMPLCRQINMLVIDDIKNEMELLNERLHRDKTSRRSVVYRLGGNK